MARLQPDYLLKMKNGKDIVTDAKWKLFEAKENESKGCDTVNISSGDVYQIFSYLHFYDAQDTAYLFVPEIGKLKSVDFKYNMNSHIMNGKYRDFKIKIIPIDLSDLVNTKKSTCIDKYMVTFWLREESNFCYYNMTNNCNKYNIMLKLSQ